MAGERLAEAHMLDFDRDIYGEKIRIEIGELLRGQLIYGSEDELVRQIASDVEAVRAPGTEGASGARDCPERVLIKARGLGRLRPNCPPS